VTLPPTRGGLSKEEIKRGGELFTKNTIFSKHVSGRIRNDSCPIAVSQIK